MDLRGDERGQAIQIGAILLFATLIILASMYQAYVIPQQTAEIEFNDYREASADVIAARNALLATASENAQHGQTVKTGSTYPARVFFVNPPPASGRVTTTQNQSVFLSNVAGVSENPNVDEYFDSVSRNLSYQTRSIRFIPDYNRFNAAPIVVTQGVVYRSYENPVTLTSQTLVQGNRITLVTLGGDLEAGGLTAALTFEPLSAHTRTVTVTGNGSQPLTLTIPTTLPASVWEEKLLVGQMDPPGAPLLPGRYVRNVSDVPGRDAVRVTFEAGEQYELRLARVLVHSESDDPAERRPDPRYVVAVGDTETRTNSEGRAKLVVESRDRFNNPVSNANVTFNASAGSFETVGGENVTDLAPGNDGVTVRTNENGRAAVYFNATGQIGELTVNATLGDDTTVTGSEKRVTYKVYNDELRGGTGGGEQAGRSVLVLNETDAPQSDNTLTIYVDNRGNYSITLTGYRLDYATGVASNGGLIEGPTRITSVLFNNSVTRTGDAIEARSPYFFTSESRQITIPANAKHYPIEITFDSALSASGRQKGVMVAVGFYIEGGFTSTYTVHYST